MKCDAAARRVPRDVRQAIAVAAANIRQVARRQLPAPWSTPAVARECTIAQRVVPLDRVGCYVPGGRYPLPSSLLMTAIPARRRRRERNHRGVPAPGCDDHARGPRGRRVAAVSPRRRTRHRGARVRHRRRFRPSTRSSGRATRTWPRQSRSSRPTAPSTSHAGPSEIADRVVDRTAGVDRRRPDRAGRARSGCAGDSADAVTPAWPRGRRASRGADARRGARRATALEPTAASC